MYQEITAKILKIKFWLICVTFMEKNKAVIDYKSLKKIDILFQKPNKNQKKLDIKFPNRPFKAKPKDENSNTNERKWSIVTIMINHIFFTIIDTIK